MQIAIRPFGICNAQSCRFGNTGSVTTRCTHRCHTPGIACPLRFCHLFQWNKVAVMHRSSLIIATALFISVPLSSELWAQAATSGESPSAQSPVSDQEFFTKASSDGAGEVQMGQLAMQKASSPQTKALAQQLVKDHTAANKQLAALASRKHANVVLQPPPSDVMDKLQSLSGSDFDKAYASAMVGGHQKAIALFDAASHSSDPDVKAFASATLPTLKHHLEMAEALSTHPPMGTP
jgi:putative membrane protein